MVNQVYFNYMKREEGAHAWWRRVLVPELGGVSDINKLAYTV